MNTSPVISKALIESRQRDMLAQAHNARLVRQAEQASRRAAREETPARRPVARWRWRLGVAALFGAH